MAIHLKPLDEHCFGVEAEKIRDLLWPVYVAGNKAASDMRLARENSYRAHHALKELIEFNGLRQHYAEFTYRHETTKRFIVNGVEVNL